MPWKLGHKKVNYTSDAPLVMEINRYTPKRWPFWTPKIKAIPSSSAPIFMGQAPLGPPTSMTLKGPAKRSTAEKLSTGCQLWRTNSTAGLRSYRNLGWHRIESGKTHEFAKWVIAKWVTSPYPSPELLGFMDVHPPKDGRDHRQTDPSPYWTPLSCSCLRPNVQDPAARFSWHVAENSRPGRGHSCC